MLLDEKYNTTKDTGETVIIHYCRRFKPWSVIPELCTKNYASFAPFWKAASKTPYYSNLIEKCTYKTVHQIQLLNLYEKKKKASV